MQKITRLTAEQEAELPRFRQEYLNFACGGARADRGALQRAMADAYAEIGKPAPALFIFDSPAACMLAIKIFQLDSQLNSQLYSQLRSQLDSQLVSQLDSQLRSQLDSQLRSQLNSQLYSQLRSQLDSQLNSQLRSQLYSQLRSQLRSQLNSQLNSQLRSQLYSQLDSRVIHNGNFLWGSHDLYWIAWGKFAERIGVKLKSDTARRLDIMDRIGRQCEWWWPFGNVVIASQRPVKARFDGERRLHCESGPAVEYADGYSLHAWRGLRIPGEWIKDGPPSAADIMRLDNTELRRIACEMRGWHNILPELGARLIDKHPNPQVGELWEADLPDNGPERFLKVECGTGRTFALPVGPKFKTARDANAATYSVDPALLDNMQFRT